MVLPDIKRPEKIVFLFLSKEVCFTAINNTVSNQCCHLFINSQRLVIQRLNLRARIFAAKSDNNSRD